MKKKRLISVFLAALVSLAPFSGFAAPTPMPNTSTSTVTSPDGTTKTVTADGDTLTTPKPEKNEDSNSDDAEDENSSESAPAKSSDVSGGEAEEATPVPQLPDGITMEDPSLAPPDIQYAQSALLMDIPSGRVLYSKNLDERVYPASTTKIMTGILTLEAGNMEDIVTAEYQALKDITLEDSQMGILVGEQLTMEQLIYGMLVHSANDAANVAAVHLEGSIDAFVEKMNQKARELGMTGTHFVNACGSHDDNHYTTARDLAILSKYAMKNEKFREIVKTAIYKIPPTNKYSLERILVSTNLFLSTARSSYYYYPPAIGVKTGHTSQAGYCLVSAAMYDDTELMAIVMNCKDTDTKEQAYSYIDSKELFNFGFDNYSHQILAKAGDIISDSKVYEAKNDMRVALTVENDVSALVPNKKDAAGEVKPSVDIPDRVDSPIKKGDIIGTVSYSYKGIQVGSANLVATNDVERNIFIHILHLILKVITSPFFFIPAVILIILILFAGHQKKKRERKRRIQQLKHARQRTSPENETGTRTPDRNASRTERVDRETKGSNSRYRK